MTSFKIENFCDEHNLEFKELYNKLNNPFYLSILLTCLKYIKHELIQKKIYNMIIENHEYVLDRLNKIDIVISFYKQNNLINKSEIGNFFKFYELHRNKININNHKHLLKLFNTLISYDNCISVLKECFYIFSNYRACIYFMTPSINFNNTKKSNVDKVVSHFKDNINTLNQIISKVYIADDNLWGSKYYSTAYAMFETLIILNKYYKDPLKEIDIIFKVNKKCPKNKIIDNLCKKYHRIKLINSEIDNKINSKNINTISQFIINVKHLGYDMWTIIPLIFNVIYTDYEFENINDSMIFGYKKIYYQKMNNKLGIMCYILVMEGFITNVNIFQNFND